jgi:hypothetical protein
MAEKLNPKRITDATRFAQIETAGLYGGYITGLTFSAKEGGVYNGSKLLEKAGGKDSVTLNATGTSEGIGSGELFYIDFVGVDYTGSQPKTGVVVNAGIINSGQGYSSGYTYTANSQSGSGTGFQFQVFVTKIGSIAGISSVISYGEGYEVGEEIPITGGIGTGGFIGIKKVTNIEGEIVYQTYAIQEIYTNPGGGLTDEDENFRSNYHIGQQITIDPTQWGEVVSQFPVTFERLDNTEDVDVISPDVSLARNSNGGGFYNSISEIEFNARSSPANTEWNSYYIDSEAGMWGFTDLSNVSTRKYGTFTDALWNSVDKYIFNTELVMHDKTTGLYWIFEFHNWTQDGEGGGFAYTRTLITDTTYAENTFTKTDYGDEVDTFSQYLSLTRGGGFNEGIYNPIELPRGYESLGGASHLWMSEPIDDSMETPAFYKENLYLTFNPDDIDIEYLKENITLEKINSNPLSWNDYQMVPWEIVYGSYSPEILVGKEMIMLDVEAGRFYRIKFTQWTQGGNGGGFAYIKSDISISQNIVATVTDITYSLENSFEKPLNNEFSLVILFDKFTKQHFVRVTNEDGTVIDHDFDGNDYTPTQLPEETTYSGYTIEEPVDGVTKVKFDWSNDISSNDRLEVEVDSDIFTIQDQYVENGKLIVELVNDITSFKEFNFTIYAYDKLGNRISDTFSIYKKPENFTGIDLVTSDYKIDVDGDHPYFLDESYHAVIYFPDELYRMFTTEGEYVIFEKNSVITEIGFPFHLMGGPGDSLIDEDVEGGFSVAAKIYHTELTQLNSDTVKDNWLLDDDFNPKILDKNSTVTGEVRIGNDEDQRYVYFPIEDFVWDGISNLLIIYYMDGQTDRDGWNGGFKQAYRSSYEEYLGFSKVTEWEGRQSPASGYKAKVNLSFTTNDTRTRS